jgi:adenosylcobinamide-GDP ribazoletransferase
MTFPTLTEIDADLRTAIGFSTRVPIARPTGATGAGLARAAWALPVAGACVGFIAAAVFWLAHTVGLAPLPAAALSIAAALVVTGCLHEDGLADVADGFGGGATRERKLAIMRDSRIGTYGTCALILSLLLRVAALAAVARPTAAISALLAAHIGARAVLPAVMRFVSPARPDGLSAGAGRPPAASVLTAAVVGVLANLILLGPVAGLLAVLAVCAGALLLAWLSQRQIGGQTGDVLGATEQISEILILLVAAARS